MARSWDIFCRVVDNYGDAAVCWRLSRQLAAEYGAQVRLWIDGLDVLRALCPQVDSASPAQSVHGVEVRHWTESADFGQLPDVVVDAFGGGLPQSYVEAIAARVPASLWVILEYLSAESWVAGHHGLPSPHPRHALARHFFFPGVVLGTGGVLKESRLDERCAAFRSDPGRQAGLWRSIGFPPPDPASVVISLFGYANPAAPELLQAWCDDARPVVAVVPRSGLRPMVAGFFGIPDPADGVSLRRGSLEARFAAFMPQDRYDELLWACDWNFVRGEDSFVRAQWALRPLVWHIYPQQERAHWAKLDSFLDTYCAGLEPELTAALRTLWQGWNGRAAPARGLGAAWQLLNDRSDRLRRHAAGWARRLALAGNLAGNLARFCEERLK